MRPERHTDFRLSQHNTGGGGTDYSLRSVVEDIKDIFSVLWSGRFWIIAVTLLFAAPAAAFLLLTPSRYEATAQIMLDPRQIKLVDGAVVPSGLGQSSVGADTLLVDSQTEIINSRSILAPVIEDLKLTQDEEFFRPRGLGIRMQLRNVVGVFLPGFRPERLPEMDPVSVVINTLRKDSLQIKRVGNTYVINVSVLSVEPEKAARIANAIADTYIKDQVSYLTNATRVATADLQSRVSTLRARVRAAEEKVEAFRRQNGLVGGPDLLVTEQQLQDLNGRLSAARAETGLARARYERLRQDTAESIAAGNTSEALENKVIVNLRALLAQSDRRLSGLSGELGPAHPALKRASQEKASVLKLIGQELARIRAVAKSEYELALANEQSLERQLESARGQVADNKKSLVELRELEREAESAKSVLESFLVRAKETSEQEGLARPNSRVIARAGVPQRPSYPPTKLLAAAAVLGGMLAGAALVWIRHVLSGPPAPNVMRVGYLHSEHLPERLVIDHEEEGDAPAGGLSEEALEAFEARLDRLRRQARLVAPHAPNASGARSPAE